MQNYILEKVCLKLEQAGKRDMGDIRAFLNWAVLEKKYLAMEWLPTSLMPKNPTRIRF